MTYAQRVPSSRDRFRRKRESKQGQGRHAMVTCPHHKMEMSLDHRTPATHPGKTGASRDAIPHQSGFSAVARPADAAVRALRDQPLSGRYRWRLAGLYLPSICTVTATIISSEASRKLSRALAPSAQRTIHRQSDATIE